MNAKEQFLDFAYVAFTVTVISFAVYFFTIPGNWERFVELLPAISALAFFIGALLLKSRLTIKKLMSDSNEEFLALNLTYFDKFKIEMILLGLPCFMLFLAMVEGTLSNTVLIICSVFFIANFILLNSLFNKR